VGKLTDLTVEAISAIKGLDVLTWLGDPIASGSMLGTEQYRIFAKPYQRRVIEAVRAAVPQNDHMLHMCGNTARLWEEMADTGAKLINIDDSIDFADASRRIGDRVHLVGNIAPMTMLIGKADDIEKDVKRSIRDSARAKTLPIPGFGDAPPLSAPIENFDILYAALRKYAKWPLDFEVLQA
jgi:uroporphyrinogen decarboxylase